MKENLTGLIEAVAGESLGVGVSLFMRQLDLDELVVSEVLGIRVTTLGKWLDAGFVPVSDLDKGELFRVSNVVSIQRSIAALFPDTQTQRAWMRSRHAELGSAPIDLIKTEAGLSKVRVALSNNLKSAWSVSRG